MKKKLFLLLFFLLMIGITAEARTGDVKGYIYSTDIRVMINGIEEPSYNIGGKTVVIAEDITSCYYRDNLRTLIIGEFYPKLLTAGKNPQNGLMIGEKVGTVYETDIKTYFHGFEIPCYSLNGKMAVAVEDLGGDDTFSETGGKFNWNPDERLLTLELIYPNDSRTVLNEKHVDMKINKDYTVEFESHPIAYGLMSCEARPKDELPYPIFSGDLIVGYLYRPKVRLSFSQDGSLQEEDSDLVYYFYDEKLREALKDTEVLKPTREDWINYYKDYNLAEIYDSLETAEYTFLYMWQPTPHGRNELMCRVSKDGDEINYGAKFPPRSIWGQRTFDDVVIDKNSELVTFKYDGEYTIDLKTGEMRKN